MNETTAGKRRVTVRLPVEMWVWLDERVKTLNRRVSGRVGERPSKDGEIQVALSGYRDALEGKPIVTPIKSTRTGLSAEDQELLSVFQEILASHDDKVLPIIRHALRLWQMDHPGRRRV